MRRGGVGCAGEALLTVVVWVVPGSAGADVEIEAQGGRAGSDAGSRVGVGLCMRT